MNEKCAYWNNGMCEYFKKKFADNPASTMDYECEEEDCPIKHPYLIPEFLTQNT